MDQDDTPQDIGGGATDEGVWLIWFGSIQVIAFAYTQKHGIGVVAGIAGGIAIWLGLLTLFVAAARQVNRVKRRAGVGMINRMGASDRYQWYFILLVLQGLIFLWLGDNWIAWVVGGFLVAVVWYFALVACAHAVANRRRTKC